MVDPEMKKLFAKSMALIFLSKGLAIASPWFLKGVVDSMAVTSQIQFGTMVTGIGLFGASRFFSTFF